jgi:hypothetical protein
MHDDSPPPDDPPPTHTKPAEPSMSTHRRLGQLVLVVVEGPDRGKQHLIEVCRGRVVKAGRSATNELVIHDERSAARTSSCWSRTRASACATSTAGTAYTSTRRGCARPCSTWSGVPRRRHQHQGRQHGDDQRGRCRTATTSASCTATARSCARSSRTSSASPRSPSACRSSSPARRARARSWSLAGCTTPRPAPRGRSWCSIARRCRASWPSRTSSATSAAPSPGRCATTRAVRAGPRRHAVHRRARRAAARAAGQAAAAARARGGRPAGRRERAQGQCPRDRGDPPRPAAS